RHGAALKALLERKLTRRSLPLAAAKGGVYGLGGLRSLARNADFRRFNRSIGRSIETACFGTTGRRKSQYRRSVCVARHALRRFESSTHRQERLGGPRTSSAALPGWPNAVRP